jgi:hypothetical protein
MGGPHVALWLITPVVVGSYHTDSHTVQYAARDYRQLQPLVVLWYEVRVLNYY